MASRVTVTSPLGETRRAGASGVIETEVVSEVGAPVVVSAPEANRPPNVAPMAAKTMAIATPMMKLRAKRG